jgi:hypothetical protein
LTFACGRHPCATMPQSDQPVIDYAAPEYRPRGSGALAILSLMLVVTSPVLWKVVPVMRLFIAGLWQRRIYSIALVVQPLVSLALAIAAGPKHRRIAQIALVLAILQCLGIASIVCAGLVLFGDWFKGPFAS